jgi:acetoin utilization deacetylase AcuC-like enzyme
VRSHRRRDACPEARMKTVYTSKHVLHATADLWIDGEDFDSDEIPERVERIREAVEDAGWGPLVPSEDSGLAPLLAVHDAGYLAYLRTAYARYAAYRGCPHPVLSTRTDVDPARKPEPPVDFPGLLDHYTYDYEEPILDGTWEAAYWSAQTALTAARLVRNGDRAAFALCRPPGHHATVDQYGGYCYMNNAGVAARFLSADGPVAVLDVDYHHGNGTQSIFYEDPAVFFTSLHGDPSVDYPYYWGYADERGAGPGLGTNLNVPLPRGTEDAAYLKALDRALDGIRGFRPAALVVSMGLDAVDGDPIGKFRLMPDGWAEVGRRTAALALPTVLVLEGGYRLEALGQLAVTFLSAF